MELQNYTRILRRSWVSIVVWMILGVAAGLGFSFISTPQYESSSELYVSVRGSDTGTSDLVQGSNFAQQAVASYTEIATSSIVLDKVIEELSLDEDVESLSSRITVTSPNGTVLMIISVTDSKPQRAADIANAVGTVLTDVVENDIEVASGDGTSPVQVATIQAGSVQENPVSPNIGLNGVLGLLIGFAIGVGWAVLRALVDTRFRTLSELESVLDAAVLGGIAYDPKIDKHPLIVHSDRMNPRAESFRSLRTNLQFIAAEGESRIFVISSSAPDEGKTTTAANLAVALAETGASVVLVDADLRKSSVSNIMGIEGGVGLTDVLIGRAELRDVLQPWGRADLAVLPGGRVPPNPSELLGSSAMQRIMKALGETVDYVIVDSPPILPVTDAAVVSRFATGTILVAAAESTKRPEIEAAAEKLETSGVRLLGVVATKLPTKGPDRYEYGAYRYGDVVEDESFAEVSTQAPPKRARATYRRGS